MTMSDEGTIWHYLGLFVGMVFLGSYLWYLLFPFGIASNPTLLETQLLMVTGIFLIASTLALGFAKTRNERIITTMLSGSLGGIHGYMDLLFFAPGAGIILFAWLAIGLLLAFSVLAWLQE